MRKPWLAVLGLLTLPAGGAANKALIFDRNPSCPDLTHWCPVRVAKSRTRKGANEIDILANTLPTWSLPDLIRQSRRRLPDARFWITGSSPVMTRKGNLTN